MPNSVLMAPASLFLRPFRRRSARGGSTSKACFVGLALAAISISGCAALPTFSQQPDLYGLSAPDLSSMPGPSVSWQLQVDTLTAPAGLDRASIATRQRPSGLDYYENVSWTDRAPVMVQRLLVEAFETSGRITGVARDTLGIRANFILRCELRDFQADTVQSDVPTAVIQTSCALVGMPDREVVARATHSGSARAEGSRFPLVISAFDRALDDVLTQIVEWALTSGEAHA